MTPKLRRARADDLNAISIAAGRAFGSQNTESDLEDFRTAFEPDRFVLAYDPDDGRVIGTAGDFPFDVTLPGGAIFSVPGVTWVTVAATHRRRGVLRAMFAEQHRGFVEAGVPVALLTASESGIYGRFGYGAATERRRIEIDRRRVAFRRGVPDPGGVRQVETDEIRKLAPAIYSRWAAGTPGAVSRNDVWWDLVLRDREHHRGGNSALFHLVHADGYASYRVRDESVCSVEEIFAVTGEAHAALWRILLSLDLIDSVRARNLAVDDPLPDLLDEPRLIRTTGMDDGLWARVLDVPTTLSARRYAVEIDVVLDVRDDFLDLGGRFRLRGGPDGAECTRVDAPPGGASESTGSGTVGMDMAALGALLFGGRRAGALARAGRLEASSPATLRRFDVAMLADRSPQHGSDF